MWTSTISAQNSRKRRGVMVQRSYSNPKACHVSSRGSARASDCVRVHTLIVAPLEWACRPSSSPEKKSGSGRVGGTLQLTRIHALFDTHDLSGRGRNPRPHIPWDVRASLAYICCGAGALPPGTSHVLHAYISIFWVYILSLRAGWVRFLPSRLILWPASDHHRNTILSLVLQKHFIPVVQSIHRCSSLPFFELPLT